MKTVKQLIAELEKLDGDLPCLDWHWKEGWVDTEDFETADKDLYTDLPYPNAVVIRFTE